MADITPVGLNLLSSLNKPEKAKSEANGFETGFGDLLKKALEEVNDIQSQSSELKEKLITGEIEDIHQVMIASEKANLSFQLTVQIRNKIVEAYQEIMRMSI